MADEYIGRDVLSINEVSALSSLLDSVNDLVINWEGSDVEVELIVVNVVDKQGQHVGAITRYTKREDVKFEPNFKAEI